MHRIWCEWILRPQLVDQSAKPHSGPTLIGSPVELIYCDGMLQIYNNDIGSFQHGGLLCPGGQKYIDI